MPFVVKKDEALDPIDVGFLSADGIMFGPDGVSDTSTSSVQARSGSFFSRRFVMIPPNLRFPLCCCKIIKGILYSLSDRVKFMRTICLIKSRWEGHAARFLDKIPQRSFIEQSVCIRFHLRYYPAIARDIIVGRRGSGRSVRSENADFPRAGVAVLLVHQGWLVSCCGSRW